MPAAAAVQVVGLAELRKELRKLEEPKGWTRELAKVHRTLARDLQPRAQAEAASLGGQQRHFAKAIKGYGNASGARLGIASAGKGQRNWGANAATWGVKDNVTGWNRSGTPNLKVPWVGNTWDVQQGQGPQPIVNTIVRETPHIVNAYGGMVDDLTRLAFPT